MDDLVTYELEGAIALVGLRRPEKRNAIGDRSIEALAKAVERAGGEAKAAVLFGHGDHFCAGLDLAEHVQKSAIEGIHGSRRWHAVFDQIQRGVVPWVAALQGAVVGGGLELAASTHVRVADRTAFFALPEGQRGIFVGGGGSVRVARADVRRSYDRPDADRAGSLRRGRRTGQPCSVCRRCGAGARAGKGARPARLPRMPAYPTTRSSTLLPRIQDMAQDDGLFVESFIASFTATSPEAEERLRAFLEKRAARLVRPDQ